MIRRTFAKDMIAIAIPSAAQTHAVTASKADANKATVGRWFTEFWGPKWNPAIVDELAAPDMLLRYSLHEPRRGHPIKGALLRHRWPQVTASRLRPSLAATVQCRCIAGS